MALNVTTAVIGSGCNAATASPSLAQWDNGQILQISGVELPETYKVEFSNGDTLEAIPAIGTAEGVEIPDKLLYSSSPIRAYIVLSEAEGERNTEYWITIYVKPREIPEDIEPTPAQQDVIDDLIAQLNTGVGKAEDAADAAEAFAQDAEAASQAVQDLGVEAETLAAGAPAAVEKIVDAETGAVTLVFFLPQGEAGVSPVVTVTTITGGHRVTVTDSEGAHTFDVMDGRSVTGVTMGADYKLTFTFSDGTTWTTPTSIRGETGATPRLTIGTVSTLDPGQSATASITGTPEDPVLNLGIPKGQAGASDAGGVTYDPTETYQSGTAGAALNDLSRHLSDLQDNTIVGLFGARWDRLTNLLTRTREAAGITNDTTNFCHKGSKNANYDNPFDSIYPWSEMVVCDVDLTKYRSGNYTLKECITAVYGDPDFTYEGSNTNFVGRYRPEFWYKSEEDADGNVEFLVSQIERSGFMHSPEAIDGISFCIDDGNGGVTAGANIPLANISVANIHTRAKNSGFTLQDIHTIDQQIILYLVEYANMNSQAAIGDGCANCYRENDADVISNVSVGNGETTFDITDSALAQYMQPGCQLDIGATRGSVTYRGLIKSHTVSGTTYTITLDRELAVTDGMIASVHGFTACEYDMISDSVGNGSGYIGTNGKANAYYRGALLYANRYSYTLGIYRQQNTNHLWVCPDGIDPDDYDALNTAVHEDTGVALPDLAAVAWQTVGGNAQRIPGVAAFMATGTSSGNSSSPVGDQQYVPLITAGSTILLFGCSAGNGWNCGAFGGTCHYGSGASNWNFAGLPILKKSL